MHKNLLYKVQTLTKRSTTKQKSIPKYAQIYSHGCNATNRSVGRHQKCSHLCKGPTQEIACHLLIYYFMRRLELHTRNWL